MKITPYTYAAAAILAIGGIVTVFPNSFAPTPARSPLVTSPEPAATITVPAPDSAVERMKKCARDLKVERQRWFFDETGMSTTIDSGAAQDYANLLEAQGVAPKRPLPFRLCE
jgi:hypothetical protein